jgi:hypothetical protein
MKEKKAQPEKKAGFKMPMGMKTVLIDTNYILA